MLRALFRAFFRGVVALVLLAAAASIYYLYRGGYFPAVRRAIEDTTIVGSVKAAYALHRDLAQRAIRVEADAGRVALSGKVATEKEKAEAEDLAEGVDGVVAVANGLEVQPGLATEAASDERSLGEQLDDVTLLAKIKTALRLDRETKTLDLEVEVRDGIVHLRGRVPDDARRVRVIERVRAVEGVERIEERLEVGDGSGSGGDAQSSK
jgi:osmotically-inducible protein OsmY